MQIASIEERIEDAVSRVLYIEVDGRKGEGGEGAA